jgi:hypothetical protein
VSVKVVESTFVIVSVIRRDIFNLPFIINRGCGGLRTVHSLH